VLVVSVACAVSGLVLPQQTASRRLTNANDDGIVIDGVNNTIGLTLQRYDANEIPAILKEIIQWIANAINPPPDSEIDYFKTIAQNVRNLVGIYVNQHNMDQILHYKADLAELLKRYANAPVRSATYPDKNTIANSFSASMISNRYLIEAVEFPHSMMLHYADLASLHVTVLKDAATTYTTADKTSRWWIDLDNQLEHYIGFGKNLSTTVVTWRNSMVSCTSYVCGEADWPDLTCYNQYTVVDEVTGDTDVCKAVASDHSCDNSCDDYKTEMNKDIAKFVFKYMGQVLEGWETLKITSAEMAKKAKNGH